MCADFHRTLHVAPRNTHSLRIKVRVRVCRITSNLEGQVMKVVEGKEQETASTSYTHTHTHTPSMAGSPTDSEMGGVQVFHP